MIYETRKELLIKIQNLYEELQETESSIVEKRMFYIENVKTLYKLTIQGFEECQKRLSKLEEQTDKMSDCIDQEIFQRQLGGKDE